MAKKKSSLANDVAKAIVFKRHGSPSWIELLTPEQAAGFNAVRDNWVSGSLRGSIRSVARAIIKVAEERGIPICGEQGVAQWLKRR